MGWVAPTEREQEPVSQESIQVLIDTCLDACAKMIWHLNYVEGADSRWTAIAYTDLQKGMMAARRAANPTKEF